MKRCSRCGGVVNRDGTAIRAINYELIKALESVNETLQYGRVESQEPKRWMKKAQVEMINALKLVKGE